MNKASSAMSFRVSAGLKNIIGRDLISDRFIAVFELVKNSYDAGASKVNISFITSNDGSTQIVISDNGCGMNYNDIIQKWLFVAYSEKKVKNRQENSYREEIKREVAGAKGVGRFSCDRLGETLQLITKTVSDTTAHTIYVNWNNFELDDSREFVEIPVDYSTFPHLPSGFSNGTTLIVGKLREGWDRDSMLRLKRSLMKLISPDANKGELPFDIEIFAPSEKETDEITLKKRDINPDRDIVNGLIRNDVFEKLNIKTTNIDVIISKDGKTITSKLTDRGQFIFTIKEKNKDYPLLNDIHISVFYLNRSAKISFTRQMGGVQPVNYGSVFIYKNGFRINPYGDPGQDFFNIDQRKAQGYARFLGTREIMGRISIKGDNEQFIETSSRAHGFIKTASVEMLGVLFLEKVLKVLEKYVVTIISWGEPLKTDPSHIIDPCEVGDKIISQFVSNVNRSDIVSIDYNPDLLKNKGTSNQNDSISYSLKKLEVVAEQTHDTGLIGLAQTVKKHTEAILSHNIELEHENAVKTQELNRTRQENNAREKQIYFLKGAATQEVGNLINGLHSIYTLTEATRGNISFLRELIVESNLDNKEVIIEVLSEIYQSNQKANKLAELAIKGNQTLKQTGSNSINDFIRQYIDAGLTLKGITYKLVADDKSYNCKFDSSSIGIILDNVASNSIKAHADHLEIALSETSENVEVAFTDNGVGLAKNIDPKMLFEWGISTTDSRQGFGIGLYHIKLLVTEMQGSIYIDTSYTDGFRLVVALKK